MKSGAIWILKGISSGEDELAWLDMYVLFLSERL